MFETIAKVFAVDVDLGKTIKKTYLDTLFSTDDSEAHRFNIILYRDNAKLTIPSGASVSAYFIRYCDDVTIPLNGSVDGNVVSVTLTKSCYNKAGQFALIIKVTTGSEISTVFYGEGAIFTSSTDSILDDEHIIPSLSELLAQIDAMEAATASANTATMNANTATDNANGAAGKANTSADTANTAAVNANEAARNANTSAETANAAAGKIDSMTVTATTLETGSPATATLETVDGHYQLNLGLPKGNTGNTGATPQISVQVATGAAGSEASVSVSGTAEEPVIHLTIPRGDTGAVENLTINGKPVESGTITLTAADLGAATEEAVSQIKSDIIDQSSIGDAWTSGRTYAVGDYCISGNQLYKCKTAHTASSAFNADYWNAVSVSGEIKEIQSNILQMKVGEFHIEKAKGHTMPESYGKLLRIGGTSWPGTAASDSYYLGVGSGKNAYLGTQLNGETEISWKKINA